MESPRSPAGLRMRLQNRDGRLDIDKASASIYSVCCGVPSRLKIRLHFSRLIGVF